MSRGRPRVYVCHPMTCYASDYAEHQIAGITSALAHCEIVDPEDCHWTSNEAWLREWPGILASLAGLVIFADHAGTVGVGCLHEIVDAVMLGVPLAAWEPGAGLVDLVGVELVEPDSRSAARAAFLDYGAPLTARTFPGGCQ